MPEDLLHLIQRPPAVHKERRELMAQVMDAQIPHSLGGRDFFWRLAVHHGDMRDDAHAGLLR